MLRRTWKRSRTGAKSYLFLFVVSFVWLLTERHPPALVTAKGGGLIGSYTKVLEEMNNHRLENTCGREEINIFSTTSTQVHAH